MGFKAKRILLKCDFIGCIPEFRILDDSRYKSIFSSILSILLIIFSIGFAIYSFYEYLNQIPKVEYYKNNDFTTNKTLVLRDTLLMFKYSFACSDNSGEETYPKIYFNFGFDTEYFTLEPCELGKNINLKYKELIEKMEKVENWKLEDFYCINYNSNNVTLYSHPSLGYVNETYLIFSLYAECEDFFLDLILVTENDFID